MAEASYPGKYLAVGLAFEDLSAKQRQKKRISKVIYRRLL